MRVNENGKLHVWELALMLSLCAALLTGIWAQGTQARLASRLVRLHVIAASDSAADQAEKLAVRDAVLRSLTPRLQSAENADEARRIVRQSERLILRAAKSATGPGLASCGARSAWANSITTASAMQGMSLPLPEEAASLRFCR